MQILLSSKNHKKVFTQIYFCTIDSGADEDKTKAIKRLHLICVGASAIAPRHEVRFAEQNKKSSTLLNSLWTDDGLVVRNEIVENADEDKTKANKRLHLICVGAGAIAPRHEVRFTK